MEVNPNIFQAYDIRGKYPAELDEKVAEAIGQAAARYFSENSGRAMPNVVVCEDLRVSSEALREGLIKGLISQDTNVWFAGKGTTPYFYFLLHKVRPDGGVMITASHSPFANLFFAAQVRAGDKGFLSSDITVADMITHRGDIHHLFPKEYLKTQYKSRREYNQIANLVYAQTEVNIKIGKKAPKDYFQEILEQCRKGRPKYGGITDEKELYKNLEAHCIPREIIKMALDDYPHFLAERRRLMAKKIEEYYKGL